MTYGFTVVLRAKDDKYSGCFTLGSSMVIPNIWLVRISMTMWVKLLMDMCRFMQMYPIMFSNPEAF